MTIDSSLRSVTGAQLAQPYQLSFTTGTFTIRYVSPRDGDTSVYPTQRIAVYFDADLDTSTVRGAFSINPPVDGLFNLTDAPDAFYFSPLEPLAPATTYSLTISTALHAADGLPLQAPFTLSFRTAPFKVTSFYPPNAATQLSRALTIWAYFDCIIDTGTVRSSFSISPPVQGVFNFSYPPWSFDFRSSSLLDPRTIYTVTIDTTLRSNTGVSLRAPFQSVFATGD